MNYTGENQTGTSVTFEPFPSSRRCPHRTNRNKQVGRDGASECRPSGADHGLERRRRQLSPGKGPSKVHLHGTPLWFIFDLFLECHWEAQI